MSKECIGLIGGHSGDALTDVLHNKGYKVALISGRENEPGVDKADYALIKDLDYHNSIIKFFNEKGVTFVIIGTGHSKAINLAKSLEENNFILSIDYNNSLFAKDKILFKKKLCEKGITTPPFINFKLEYNIDDIIKKIGIPCVVKSATDATQPEKVNTKSELVKAIKSVTITHTEVLIEKYISGNDCTVAILNDGKTIRDLGVTYYSKAKEYKLKGFENAYSMQLPKKIEDELCDIAIKIVDEFQFLGLIRVDFIVDEQIHVLELNSVIVTGYNGSAYPFFQRQGINIANVMVENALNIYCHKVKEQ